MVIVFIVCTVAVSIVAVFVSIGSYRLDDELNATCEKCDTKLIYEGITTHIARYNDNRHRYSKSRTGHIYNYS